MPTLEEAVNHLGKAVERMTRSIETGTVTEGVRRTAVLSESLQAVQKERDDLQAQLEALRLDYRKSGLALRDSQEHYAAMQVVSEAVANRLDSVINDLKTLAKE